QRFLAAVASCQPFQTNCQRTASNLRPDPSAAYERNEGSVCMRTPIGALVFAAIWLLPRPGEAQVQNSPASLATGIRVACFSPQRAFADSSDGKAALARLNALEAEKARAVDARQKALRTQEEAFERSAPVLSAEARNQRTKELERLRIDTQRFIQD